MRARQTNRKTNKLHLRTKMAIRCPGGKGWLRQWSLGGNLLFQRCSQSFFHCQDHAQKWYIYEQMLYLGNAITAKKTTKVKSSCLTHKENSKMLRGFGTGFIEMLLVMCNNKLLGNFEQQPALQTKDVSLLYCELWYGDLVSKMSFRKMFCVSHIYGVQVWTCGHCDNFIEKLNKGIQA